MDIAKYIGLYLLKNQYCYVHGLGNMELRKMNAKHDGKELQAPYYDVLVTPGGSIDDNLANFIATNEQISISKAANALREYSMQARKDLAEGKEVPIPNIGRFTELEGKIRFKTDDNFAYKPAPLPTIKNSKQLEEQNSKPAHKPSYPPPAKADSINWSMVILVAVLVLVVAGTVYFVYSYMNNTKVETATIPPPDTTAVAPAIEPDTTVAIVDTVDASAPVIVDSTLTNEYKFVIGNYRTRERAEKRVYNLNLNGSKTELLQQDSTNFLVIEPINCRIMDTTHVKDSLRRMFGFQDVRIMY